MPAPPVRCRDDIQPFFGRPEISKGENLDQQSFKIVSTWLDSISHVGLTPPTTPLSSSSPPLLLHDYNFASSPPQLLYASNSKAAAEVKESNSPSNAHVKRRRLTPHPQANPPPPSPSPSIRVLAKTTRAKVSGKQPPTMSPQKKQTTSGVASTSHEQDEGVERSARGATTTRAKARQGQKTGTEEKEKKKLYPQVLDMPREPTGNPESQRMASLGPVAELTPFSLRQSRPASPTKSSSTGRGSGKGSVPLTKVARMAFLTPSVRFHAPDQITDKKSLPDSVKHVWLTYFRDKGHAVIPREFKVRDGSLTYGYPLMSTNDRNRSRHFLDTPMKSRTIADSIFASNLPNYHQEDHPIIMSTIKDIVAMATEYRHTNCTEAHWISVTVSPMLNLVKKLRCFQGNGKQLKALDLSYVKISPSSLCTYDSDDHFSNLDKKIDFALGLKLPVSQTEQLERGVYNIKETGPSINQTSSFINLTPVFLNVEVKIPNTDKDPLIQLGAWISAEFAKRVEEGYSLAMPALALEVVGDNWNLYITYADVGQGSDAKGYAVRFIGPFELGSTTTIEGGYRILDGICRCANWGTSAYKDWFKLEILEKYRPQHP